MQHFKKESKFKSPSVNKGQPQLKVSPESLGIKSAYIQQSSDTPWINPNNPYLKRKNHIDEKQIKEEEKNGITSYYNQARYQNIGASAEFTSIICNLKLSIDRNVRQNEQPGESFRIVPLFPSLSTSIQQDPTQNDQLSDEEVDEEDEQQQRKPKKKIRKQGGFAKTPADKVSQLIASMTNLTLSNMNSGEFYQPFQDNTQGTKFNFQQQLLQTVQNQQHFNINPHYQPPSQQYLSMLLGNKNPSARTQRQNHRKELMKCMIEWNIRYEVDNEEVIVDILSKMNIDRAKQWLYYHHRELQAMASTILLVAIKELSVRYDLKHDGCDSKIKALNSEQLMKQYTTLAAFLKRQKEPDQLICFKEGQEVLKQTMGMLFEKGIKNLVENLNDLIDMGLDQKLDDLTRDLSEVLMESYNMNNFYLLEQINRYYELEQVQKDQKQLREIVSQVEKKLDEMDKTARDHMLVTHIKRCQETTKRVELLEGKIMEIENNNMKPKFYIKKSQINKRITHIKEKIKEAEKNASKMRDFLNNHKKQ